MVLSDWWLCTQAEANRAIAKWAAITVSNGSLGFADAGRERTPEAAGR